MRQVVCAVVLALTVAACGGGDDGDDAGAAGSSTTTAPSSSSTGPPAGTEPSDDTDPGDDDGGEDDGGEDDGGVAPTQDRAADQRLAESIVLRAGDAPAGWDAEPGGEDEDSEYDRRYAECVGVPIEHVDPDFPGATGDDLTSPEDAEVTSDVIVAPTTAGADALLAAYQDPDTPRCFTDVLEDVMRDAMVESGAPPGFGIEAPTFASLPFPAMGDDTVAFRVTMGITANGQTIPLYADAVYVRAGRVGIGSLFMSIGTPFPTQLSERLTGVMVDRVPANA